jgi:microcystin-dependent protein
MDYFLGNIVLFPYSFTPYGWLLCNGQILQINQNTALFSLIGTTYGGNGTTTFAVPNMLGLEPAPGTGYYICVSGIYPTRD